MIHALVHLLSGINRTIHHTGHHRSSTDMIGMIVRNQESTDGDIEQIVLLENLTDGTPTDARIDEYGILLRAQIIAVATAAAT